MDKHARDDGQTVAPGLVDWGAGIYSIDSGYIRPGFDAIHLIVQDGRVAIVDSGTVHSVPRVLAALDTLGIGRDQVDWVVLTHVHLDHAGGAGALLEVLPEARLTVHPRGARHMIDPSRLWAATVEVYGREEAEAFYGRVVPVPAERLVETGEGATIDLAGRTLAFLDTPGHARHHVVVRDGRTGHLFTGDMFGVSYRDLDVDGRPFIAPSSTPVQFDPEAMQHSLDRLLALEPGAVYLTHYARLTDVADLGARLKRLTMAYVTIAEDALAAEVGTDPGEAAIEARLPALQTAIRGGLERLYRDELVALGAAPDPSRLADLLGVDITLNADGLIDWLRGRARVGSRAGAGTEAGSGAGTGTEAGSEAGTGAGSKAEARTDGGARVGTDVRTGSRVVTGSNPDPAKPAASPDAH